jgi:hypothetical protein
MPKNDAASGVACRFRPSLARIIDHPEVIEKRFDVRLFSKTAKAELVVALRNQSTHSESRPLQSVDPSS